MNIESVNRLKIVTIERQQSLQKLESSVDTTGKVFASAKKQASGFLVKLHASSNVLAYLNFSPIENYCDVVMKSHNDVSKGNAIMTYRDVESKQIRYVKIPGEPINALGEFLLDDEFFAVQYDIQTSKQQLYSAKECATMRVFDTCRLTDVEDAIISGKLLQKTNSQMRLVVTQIGVLSGLI